MEKKRDLSKTDFFVVFLMFIGDHARSRIPLVVDGESFFNLFLASKRIIKIITKIGLGEAAVLGSEGIFFDGLFDFIDSIGDWLRIAVANKMRVESFFDIESGLASDSGARIKSVSIGVFVFGVIEILWRV